MGLDRTLARDCCESSHLLTLRRKICPDEESAEFSAATCPTKPIVTVRQAPPGPIGAACVAGVLDVARVARVLGVVGVQLTPPRIMTE
jgi:hypothetical protein